MIPLDVRLENFLGVVEFVADEKTQRKVWLEKTPGITSIISIGELFCQFFDDNDMDGFIKAELSDSPLSPEQKKAVLQFRNVLGKIEELRSYQEDNDRLTLETQEWRDLVHCARNTLKVFSTSGVPHEA